MSTLWIYLLRRTTSLLWVGLLAFLLALVVVSHISPMMGRSLFVIRGGSMSPAMPLGSLAFVEPVDPGSIVAGDVVTLRGDTGRIVTHRITRVIGQEADLRFEVRGDANATSDPILAPASSIVGRVAFFAPFLGYTMAMLAMPSGMISLMALIGTFLLGSWLLEEIGGGAAALRPPSGSVSRPQRAAI